MDQEWIKNGSMLCIWLNKDANKWKNMKKMWEKYKKNVGKI